MDASQRDHELLHASVPYHNCLMMSRLLVHGKHPQSHHEVQGKTSCTFPCRAILSENEFMNLYTSNNDPYDQYEVSVPIEIVGDCMAKV